jgi:hypothetical protein
MVTNRETNLCTYSFVSVAVRAYIVEEKTHSCPRTLRNGAVMMAFVGKMWS